MSGAEILFSFIPSLFYSQFFVTPKKPTTDCTGKVVIVTGANVGLGKEAARHFARLNAAKVIIACRSVEKGEAARRDIEASTARPGALEVWPLDLSDYASVQAFARKAQDLPRLDVLVENAGVSTRAFSELAGNESTITVNVVSTFLLALLMLPKLQETAQRFNLTPTLTIVTSELHAVTQFPESKSPSIFPALNDAKTARMADRYNVSKLLEVLAGREMVRGRPVAQLHVAVNLVNPGWCHSELMREMSNPAVTLLKKIFCRTTEVGGRTLVHAGLAGPDSHGMYFSDCKVHACAPLVEGPRGPELQRRVWGELAAKLEEIAPGVTKVLEG